MQFLDFSAVLVLAAAITGSIWILDVLVLAPRRARTLDFDGGVRGGGKVNGEQGLPWYVDFSRSFFPVILVVLILRSFIVEPFRIPSSSMEPTLYPGDFILVNKFSFGVRLPVIHTKILDTGEPERGDVTVFRYPQNPSVAYIKRIIGVPGDHLEYRDKQLYINGVPVSQEELPATMPDSAPGYRILEEHLGDREYLTKVSKHRSSSGWEGEVPAGHYFALGDNRDDSRDSRYWGFLPEENLIGKAFLIWMNWDCVTGGGNCNRIGRGVE
jgi:signal peptidase I